MNPIEQLLHEHRAIMAQVADLRAVVRDLAARGDAALSDALPVLNRIGQMIETQLALHAKKEDEALFPALEAILDAEGGPTHMMRLEHREIHSQGELLRQTLHELNRVEHPQIEAQGTRLRALAATGGGAEALRANAQVIIQLLDAHFGKEEQILFPMAESLLDKQALAEVEEKIQAMMYREKAMT